MSYRIDLATSAVKDLQRLRKFDRVKILEAVETQLSHEPMTETRSRKELRDNILARWELRVGDHRVFYNVSEDEQVVQVTAVGYKVHNRLFVGGKEVEI